MSDGGRVRSGPAILGPQQEADAGWGNDVNKLINSPQNLGTTAPLDYIYATRNAGYEAIRIRLYRAPGRTYNFNPIVGNPTLMRDVKHTISNLGLEMYDIYSYYLQPTMEWD